MVTSSGSLFKIIIRGEYRVEFDNGIVIYGAMVV